MKLRTALVAAGVLALPVTAIAQPVEGLYVGAGVGYNYSQGQKVKQPAGLGSFKGSSGIAGLASVGFGFSNGFRVELEGDYRNTVQKGSGNKDRNETYGGFVTGLFDLDIGADFMFPYLGVGVGWQEAGARRGRLSDGLRFSGTKGGPAAQGIVGAAFPIPDMPGLSATAEYRFMTTLESHTYGVAKLGAEYNHTGLLGLRYVFGVEPPPPAPAPASVVAPAPAPARTYLVFFDWDRADLTARARQIIAEAAQNASRVKVTRIEVAGYADRTGTAAYNQRLSQHRADNVATELVRLGVSKADIAVMAYGDTRPLVPTAAGVREPQNRRVEIVLK